MPRHAGPSGAGDPVAGRRRRGRVGRRAVPDAAPAGGVACGADASHAAPCADRRWHGAAGGRGARGRSSCARTVQVRARVGRCGRHGRCGSTADGSFAPFSFRPVNDCWLCCGCIWMLDAEVFASCRPPLLKNKTCPWNACV
eukprot:230027-Chlamydomonas_euryale.AAC.1